MITSKSSLTLELTCGIQTVHFLELPERLQCTDEGFVGVMSVVKAENSGATYGASVSSLT